MPGPSRVFIASASEGLDVAHAVRDALSVERLAGILSPKVWDKDVFHESYTFIESIEEALDQSDFAIVTFTPDDLTTSRRKPFLAPRDNVVFELGYAMGRLGRFGRLGRVRTYFLAPEGRYLKIPSDLAGVQSVRFQCEKRGDLTNAVALACSSLTERMAGLGPRVKLTADHQAAALMGTEFCTRVAGWWWQLLTTEDRVKLSFVAITPEPAMSTVSLAGPAFDNEGCEVADWRSVGVGVRPNERTIVYTWTGGHGTDEGYLGFGHYRFVDDPGHFRRGVGLFADIHNQKETIWKKTELHRVDEVELDSVRRTMALPSGAAQRQKLVKDVVARLTGSGGKLGA